RPPPPPPIPGGRTSGARGGGRGRPPAAAPILGRRGTGGPAGPCYATADDIISITGRTAWGRVGCPSSGRAPRGRSPQSGVSSLPPGSGGPGGAAVTPPAPPLILTNCRAVTPSGILDDATIVLHGGAIERVQATPQGVPAPPA